MKGILSLFFLLVLSCNNNKNNSKEVANKNDEIIKDVLKDNKMFEGLWVFESFNNKDSFQDKTFEINLYSNKDETFEGNYCSISWNGSKIDCFKDDEPNIFGKLIKDTLFIKFASS